MKLLRFALVVTAIASGLSACASVRSESTDLNELLRARDLVLAEPVNKVRYHSINGWNKLDDKHVIINAGLSDQYLLVLRNACRDLDSSMDIGFSSSLGNLTTADKLIVKGPGRFEQYCYISTITRLKKGA